MPATYLDPTVRSSYSVFVTLEINLRSAWIYIKYIFMKAFQRYNHLIPKMLLKYILADINIYRGTYNNKN